MVNQTYKMNAKFFYAAIPLVIIGAASCNNIGTITPGTNDSTTVTTTTTTTVHRKYAGSFVPQPSVKYMDLRTNREISIRVDTSLGEIVNDETNDPIELFVEPRTHDTIYAVTGAIVNNFIIHDSTGTLRVDTIRLNSMGTAVRATIETDDVGKVKYKEKAKGKVKYKDDHQKIKEKNGVTITTHK